MNSIKKNFVYLSLYKVLEMLLPMVTSPLLSRRLGAEALGRYTYNHSIVSMFVVFAELGCYRYGMREIAKARNDAVLLRQTYSDIYFLHFFNGAVVSSIYFVWVIASGQANNIYLLLLAGFLFSNMIDNSFLFVGLENIGVLSFRDGTIKLVTFVLVLLLVKSPDDLLIYTLIMVLGTIFCKVAAAIYSGKYVKLIQPVIKNCARHFKPMAVLMVPALAAVIYQSMDKIMIGWFYDNESVGYYECASKALIPKSIITALGTVLCPRIANMYAEKKYKAVREMVGNSFVISMAMSFAFMFGISSIANEFAPWFWGEEFCECSSMMIGLSVSIPIWCIGEVIRNQYLLPTGRDNEYTISFIAGVAVNAAVNMILIPPYGAMGAIVSTLLAEITMSAVQMWFVRKELACGGYLVQSFPYAMIGALMFIGVRLCSKFIKFSLTVSVCFECFIGICLFGICVVLYEKTVKKPFLIDMVVKKFVKGNRLSIYSKGD